jgi:hypothetical protein
VLLTTQMRKQLTSQTAMAIRVLGSSQVGVAFISDAISVCVSVTPFDFVLLARERHFYAAHFHSLLPRYLPITLNSCSAIL